MVAHTPRTPARSTLRTPAKRRATTPRRMTARRRLNFGTPSTPSVMPRGRNTIARVGYTPNTASAYRRITVDSWEAASAAVTSKTLIANELTAIPRKTSVEINGRERDMINCLGFTLRFSLRNLVSSPYCIRMAVVSPIDALELSPQEFFRGYGNKRGESFASLLDASQLLYNPINRDKYAVLWEKKLTVGPTQVAVGARVSRHFDTNPTFQTYVPLNRQLRYENAAANSCSDKIYLVCWFDLPDGVGAAAGLADQLQYRRLGIAHWKDPGN